MSILNLSDFLGRRYLGYTGSQGIQGETGFVGSKGDIGFTGSRATVITDTSLSGDGTVTAPLSVLKFATPVNISLSGEVSGSVSFDGSANVEISTSVNSVISFTRNITLTSEWQNVGISGTDLSTGTYYVQLYANDIGAGGKSIKEYHSGIMSWFSEILTEASELPSDEIPLHRAGGGGDGIIFLRTFRAGAGEYLQLQMNSSYENTSSANYVFKFRKII